MLSFIYGTLIDTLLRNVRRLVVKLSGLEVSDMVIDVCCGTGAQVLEYGRHNINAIGIDSSQDMLRMATRNRMKHKMMNVSFQLANAAYLPFPDDCFDYATVSFALHDKEKSIRYQIISEMKRIVKKDGALILIDFQVPLPKNVWAVFVRIIEFLAGGSHYRGFKDYLANGGLKDILNNHDLKEEYRTYLKNGLIAAVKVVNN